MIENIVKHFIFVVSKFDSFNENDTVVYINFGADDIPWHQIVDNLVCKFVTIFLIFVLYYTLWYLLESLC